ncbi:MAG TPA: hypothetical protein VHL50_05130, partial [Pyrinomonadaceae bacterium]|nr:hypothetical protein [Pyrinomonadaceae bacterium]
MQRLLKSTSLLIAALILVGCSQLNVVGQNDVGNNPKLEGVWQTVVTPRNCATGDPVAPSFPGILLFENGGTMTGTSTAVTSTYGLWRREPGVPQYSFTTLALRYNAAGISVGSRRISQAITLEFPGSTFNSTGTFQDYDVNGNVVMSGCAA